MLKRKILRVFQILAFLAIIFTLVELGLKISLGDVPPDKLPEDSKVVYEEIFDKFFRIKEHDGNKFYVAQRLDNLAEKFPVKKDKNTVRIFILGGSVAWNWSYFDKPQTFGVSDLIDTLSGLYPDNNFEIINCGMNGYDSWRVFLLLREILKYKPDLAIIMSGNNEFYEPGFNLFAYRINNYIRRFWVFRLPQDFLISNLRKNLDMNRGREGRLAEYKKNIHLMAEEAKKHGVPLIYCTLPGELKDYPPSAENRPVNERFILGLWLMEQGFYFSSLGEFNNFLSEDPGSSFGSYYMGKVYENMGDLAEARNFFIEAIEKDAKDWQQAIPESNRVLKEAAEMYGMGLVDFDSRMQKLVPYGLLGKEQFYDHCHWWEDYYSLLAEMVIQELYNLGQRYQYLNLFNDKRIKHFSLDYNPPSLEELGTRNEYLERLTKETITWLIKKEIYNPQSVISEHAVALLSAVYSMNQGFFSSIGLTKETIADFYFTIEEPFNFPYDFEYLWSSLLFHIGETYRRHGRREQALDYFDKVLSSKADFYSAYLGKAIVYHQLGQSEKASLNMEKALSLSQNKEVIYYRNILGL